MLKEAVATEKAKGGFDDLSSEPVVLYSPQGSYPQRSELCSIRGPWIPL